MSASLLKSGLLRSYQRDWLADRARLKSWCKSRRIGGSFAATLDHSLGTAGVDLVAGTAVPPADGLIFAASHAQAKHLLEACAQHIRVIGSATTVRGGIVEHLGALRIKLSNGHSLYAFANSADAARGYEGHVLWDEAGATPNARPLYQAIKPLVDGTLRRPEGYRLSIVGTALDDASFFHDICETRAGSTFSRHRTTIHDAVAAGFPADVDALREEVGDPDVFAAEYECCFWSAGSRYIAAEVYDPCVYSELPIFDRPGVGGMDVARKGHKSAIVEVRPHGEQLWVTGVHAERGLSWEAQERWVGEVLSRNQRLAIDATGLGNAFAERLTNLHGEGRIESVVFTQQSKAELVTGLKLALERRILRLPPEPSLRRAVLSIKRKVTEAGTVTFGAAESADGHADEAWALALALRAGLPGHLTDWALFRELNERLHGRGYGLNEPPLRSHEMGRWSGYGGKGFG